MRIPALFVLLLLPLTSHAQTSHRPMTEDADDLQPRFLTTQATLPLQHDHVYLASLQQWRTRRAAELTAPNGWFSLVALEWLKPGDTTLGSAPGSTVHLASAPPHLATLHLVGSTMQLLAPAAGLTANNQPITGPLQLTYDEHATELRYGSLLLIVIQRGDRLYLRVRDANAPTRLGFHGLDWYPPDPKLTITARWIPAGAAGTLSIPNVLGQVSEEATPGMAEFTLYGQTIRLFPIVEDPHDPQPLFFIFRDATSKTSTYGAGRFLYAANPSNGLGRPGTILLDFNKAQNPPCAYTPYATCPLPPQQNRLTIPIPAGEKRYHE